MKIQTCLLLAISAANIWSEPSRVANRGPMVLGGNAHYPPLTYMENGVPKGVVVDIVHEIQRKMDRPVEIRLMEWKDAQSQVLAGQMDALAPMSPTDARKLIYDFSDPIIDLQVSIFVVTGKLGVSEIADLHGLRVGATEGSLAMQMVRADSAIRAVPLPDSLLRGFQMLRDGRLDAIVADHWVGNYLLAQNRIADIQPVGKPVGVRASSIAVKKGNVGELARLNAAIAALRSDGTLEMIYERWRSKEVVVKTREEVLRGGLLLMAGLVVVLLVVGTFWIMVLRREISRRKLSESMVQESEDRYRTLIEHAPEAIAVFDMGLGRFIDANAAAERLFGCDRAELLRDGPLRFYPSVQPDERDVGQSFSEHMKRVLDGETVQFERAIRSADGRELVCEVNLVRLPSGSNRRLRASFIDITERKRNEARLLDLNRELLTSQDALRSSDARFRTLVENAPICIGMHRDGIALYANAMYLKTFGIACAEDVVGKSLLEMIAPEAHDQIAEYVKRRSQGLPVPVSYETIGIRRDGTRFPLSVYVSSIELDDGPVSIVFHADIQEQKQAEEELRKYRIHLEELVARRTEELSEARDAAESANRAKSLFLANMSHELRTPLNAILGFSQILFREGGLEPAQTEKLGVIVHAGDHLLAIINDILDLAKIESGKIGIEPVDCDIGALVHDLLVLLRVRAEAKGIDLVFDQSSSFPRFVRVDPAKLRQILFNLVGNAIKFTQQGGVAVKLSSQSMGTDPTRQKLFFEIADTGVGIPPEDLDRIFEPFVQLQEREGTGLGLTITRQFIRMMGGDLGVESEPGKGSVFRFSIDCERIGAESIPELSRVRGNVTSIVGAGAYRILVVEDHPDNRLLLRSLLEPFGFQVREASNGEEGIKVVGEWHPHLVLMDRRMPVMDGLTATQAIRSLSLPDQPVIVAITAHAFQEEREEAMVAGCDDFLAKPFLESEFFQLLEKHLHLEIGYESVASGSREGTSGFTAEMASRIPPGIRQELTQALAASDMLEIEAVLSRVRNAHPREAEIMHAYTDRFEYAALAKILASGVET